MKRLKKSLVIAIIFLFIGISIAPGINLSVVKASTDNDLVEVTTQACGIKGFGDTTVKLTREQYQNLEQYLVEFRARLNQTTSRDEAIPIFKEAVIELNKYGLLPKGMNVEQAQKLVMGQYQNKDILKFQERLLYNSISDLDNNSNYLCLIAGKASMVISWGFPARFLIYSDIIINKLIPLIHLPILIQYLESLDNRITSKFSEWWLDIFCDLMDKIFLFKIFTCLSFGMGSTNSNPDFPSVGWIYSNGLNGIKSWNNSFIGNISKIYIYRPFIDHETYFISTTGFTGITITTIVKVNTFLIGTAFHVAINSTSLKENL